MEISVFEQIASSLTVKSICSPLGPNIPDRLFIGDLESEFDPSSYPMWDPYNDPSRVTNDAGEVIGVLCFGDYCDADNSTPVTECMEVIEPHEFLTASTSIFDAVEIFGNKSNNHFYVTEINDVVGVLNFRDLFRPIGRLAFLALTLEIEDEALRICQHPPLRDKCWNSLSEGRRNKALELFGMRHAREPRDNDVSRLIECTNLVDKARMIWQQRLLDNATRSDVLGLFNKMKIVRDKCAHPGGDAQILPRAELAGFVGSANSVRKSLRHAMMRHGVDPRNREQFSL
jgi:hypothetical protein